MSSITTIMGRHGLDARLYFWSANLKTGATKEGMLESLGVALDGRGNVNADTVDYQTSIPGVFSAGDMRRGQSLVVWAIRDGCEAADAIAERLNSAARVAAE